MCRAIFVFATNKYGVRRRIESKTGKFTIEEYTTYFSWIEKWAWVLFDISQRLPIRLINYTTNTHLNLARVQSFTCSYAEGTQQTTRMNENGRKSRIFISVAINNDEINYRLKLSAINHFIFIIVEFGSIFFGRISYCIHFFLLPFFCIIIIFRMTSGRPTFKKECLVINIW